MRWPPPRGHLHVHVDDRSDRVSLAERAEHCMANYEKRMSSTNCARNHSHFDNHILPKWGGVRLSRSTKAKVKRWVEDLADPIMQASSRQRFGARDHPRDELGGGGSSPRPCVRKEVEPLTPYDLPHGGIAVHLPRGEPVDAPGDPRHSDIRMIDRVHDTVRARPRRSAQVYEREDRARCRGDGLSG